MPKKIKDETIIDLNSIFTILWKGKFIIIFSILISISIFFISQKFSQSKGTNFLFLNGNFSLSNVLLKIPEDDLVFEEDLVFEKDLVNSFQKILDTKILFEKFAHYIKIQNKNVYPKNLSEGFDSFIVSDYNTQTGIINLQFIWKDFDEAEKIFNEIIINTINMLKNDMFNSLNQTLKLNNLALEESLNLISLRKKLAKLAVIEEKEKLIKILSNRRKFALIIQNSEFYKNLSENEKLNLINQDYQLTFSNENFQVNLSQGNLESITELDLYLGRNPELINENIKLLESKTDDEFLFFSIYYQSLISEENAIINKLKINDSIYKSLVSVLESINFQNMFLYNKKFKKETQDVKSKLILFILLGIFIGSSILYFRENK